MKVILTNPLNRQRVFTMKGNKTLRILAYGKAEIDEKQLSGEIINSIESGLLGKEEVPQKKTATKSKSKEE